MSRLVALGALALPLLAFAAGEARAQDSDVIVVTATRSNAALADIPESVSLVTQADIKAVPAKALDEVLRAVPSVNLPTMASYQLHPNLDTVGMRGLSGNRALVLLDGVPLNDPFFGFVQWSLVPTGNVDRIEVVRGGGAALWGNYAMGGVINVVTRAPGDARIVQDIAAGSYGTLRVDSYGSVPLSSHVRLGVSAATMRTDGYDPVSAAYRVPLTVPSYFRADNIQGALDFDVDSTLSGTVRAGYHDTQSVLHTPVNTSAQRAWNVSGNLVKRFGNSTLTLTAFHNWSRLLSANSDTPTGAVAGSAEYVQNYHVTPATSDGGSLVWTLTGPKWLPLFSLGADFQELHGSDVGNIFNSAGVQIRTDRARGGQRFAGVFAQADLEPFDGLSLLVSGRLQNFENFGGFDGAPGGPGGVANTSRTSFNPRVSARYDITPNVALRTAGYTAFRAPVMNSLYRTFSNRFGIFYSNAALTPETLRGVEGGFDVNVSNFRAQVTYYYSEVDDLLTTRRLTPAERPAGFTFGTRNINAGSARAQGVEAEINWRLNDRLSVNLGYAYADTIITSNPADPATVGKQLGGVARHTGSARVIYTGAGGWTLSTNLFWHNRLFSDNAQLLPLESQFLVGAGASYPVTHNFEVYGQVQNLFNERHVGSNAGTSAPELETPFTALLGVRARF